MGELSVFNLQFSYANSPADDIMYRNRPERENDQSHQ